MSVLPQTLRPAPRLPCGGCAYFIEGDSPRCSHPDNCKYGGKSPEPQPTAILNEYGRCPLNTQRTAQSSGSKGGGETPE